MLIETHLHYGGCISPEFIFDNVETGYSLQQLCDLMRFSDSDELTFYNFLSKFKILDNINWTEELIDKSIEHVCDGIIAQQLDFVWLDLSINKYRSVGWSGKQAIRFIKNGFDSRLPGKVGLLLSLKYEEDKEANIKMAKLLNDCEVFDSLIGIDIVGDEGRFDHKFFKPIFEDWNRARKITRAHVGESGGVDNIKNAIEHMSVTNIAHGIKIIEDPNVVSMAIDNYITFDIAISSNRLTGVWDSSVEHPGVRMLNSGLRCTLGSDDPVQCSTTLSNEYEVALRSGFTQEHLETMRLIAFENSSVLRK